MITKTIPVPGEQARYNIAFMGEYEYVNPIEKIGEAMMAMHAMQERSVIDLEPNLIKILEGEPNREIIFDRVERRP